MKINNQVHLIRKEFFVTSEVKRYINIYIIVGKHCYLVDSGVTGSHTAYCVSHRPVLRSKTAAMRS